MDLIAPLVRANTWLRQLLMLAQAHPAFLQPGVAVILAIRAGLRDARAGRRPYFWAVLMDLDHRKDLLREGWKNVGKVFVVARGPGRDLSVHRFLLALS
jgi:hypothetical protein